MSWTVFEGQCRIALGNLERVFQAVGNRASVVFMSGTDFGTQKAPFISNAAYRELYLPFHRRLNGLGPRHTEWKTFIHSCGSVAALIEDLSKPDSISSIPSNVPLAGMEPSD